MKTLTDKEIELVVRITLLEIAKTILETEAAGPCGYWNKKIANNLIDKSQSFSYLPRTV